MNIERAGGVRFHHYSGGTNLGDLLCSPKHYFEFTTDLAELNIIGGGTLDTYFTGKKEAPANAVIWGVGSGSESPRVVEPDVIAWGARDWSLAGGESHFLPCVSCMHPMLDLSPTDNLKLIFLNADPNIVPAEALIKLAQLSRKLGFTLLTNRATEREFIDTWSKAAFVVTNSYHGAYWSMLAGKEVAVYGHNFKFQSLLQTLGVDGDAHSYRRGDIEEFLFTTGFCMGQSPALRLPDARKTLKEFRDRQMDFASSLISKKVINSYRVTFCAPGSSVSDMVGNQTERLRQLYGTEVFVG